VPGKCGESWRAVILIATCCTVICLALVNVATLIAQQILTTLSDNSNIYKKKKQIATTIVGCVGSKKCFPTIDLSLSSVNALNHNLA